MSNMSMPVEGGVVVLNVSTPVKSWIEYVEAGEGGAVGLCRTRGGGEAAPNTSMQGEGWISIKRIDAGEGGGSALRRTRRHQ